MSAATHQCIRCGIAVYVAGSFCRDCRAVDPQFCKGEAA